MTSSPPCPASRAALVFASARAAFRVTIPILIGFVFCGFSYGLYMRSLGFEPIFPILMALTIFAGSLEFIMASMLTGPFAPLTAMNSSADSVPADTDAVNSPSFFRNSRLVICMAFLPFVLRD